MSSLSIRFGAHTSRCAEICTREQVHISSFARMQITDTSIRGRKQQHTHGRTSGSHRGCAVDVFALGFVRTCFVSTWSRGSCRHVVSKGDVCVTREWDGTMHGR
eukprot:6910023-Prymnesium_polylepis.1